MALPEQAIQKMIREPAPSQGAYRELVMFSVALFAIALIIYVGLTFGYKPYLQAQVDALDKQVQSFNAAIPADQKSQLISAYSQLVNLQTLLVQHGSAASFLTWFEAHTHPNVYYTQFALNALSGQLTLSGVGKSLGDVAEQLAIFERDPKVTRINFTNVSPGIGGIWQFNLTLFFDQSIFRPAQ